MGREARAITRSPIRAKLDVLGIEVRVAIATTSSAPT